MALLVGAEVGNRVGSRKLGAAFQLSLLAGFDLRCEGSRVTSPLAVQRLLAFLALHDRPLHRRFVAGCLWLDVTEERAAANLRATLWRTPEPRAGLVESTPTQIALAPSVIVDHRAAVARARRLIDHDAVVVDGDLDERLLAADLLPGWCDDWVVVERERMRQLRLHALEALCLRLAERGDGGRAVDVGLLAVAAEPLRESAQRALIRAHVLEGNTCEALRQYAGYRSLLGDTLGLAPSPLMEHLVAGLIDRRDTRDPST